MDTWCGFVQNTSIRFRNVSIDDKKPAKKNF